MASVRRVGSSVVDQQSYALDPSNMSASNPTLTGAGTTMMSPQSRPEYRDLIAEMREQDFDTIRFATYRAACKLRFIQKKVNLHLVDIWNIIESFRENGLNVVDYKTEIKSSRVELLLSTIYHNLNKRLPASQQIDTDHAINLLSCFLLAAYDPSGVNKLRVFSVKVALATLCAGKLLDKLRYVFSQIQDSSGIQDHTKFADYLKEVLALPVAVFEGPTFQFTDAAVKSCFDPKSRVTVNVFLDTIMSDPAPPCLMWLPLLHRMASVEHVFHPVQCDACARDSFSGFRYKCQRCHNYQLCQDCFWRGKVSGSHLNEHEMKEYSSYKSPAKQLGHSIGKSLRCMPHQPQQQHQQHGNILRQQQQQFITDTPDKTLDLTNVVPYTPPPTVRNGFLHTGSMARIHEAASLGSFASDTSPARGFLNDIAAATDDEHRLIARYSAKLSNRSAVNLRNRYNSGAFPLDQQSHRAAIAQLEQKNKDMIREIQRLQAMHTAASLGAEGSRSSLGGTFPRTGTGGTALESELSALRSRKDELEGRMMALQDSRRDLMGQLEHLMSTLKTSAPHMLQTPHEMSPSSLAGLGGNVKSAFQESTPSRIGYLGMEAGHTGSLGRRGVTPMGTMLGHVLGGTTGFGSGLISTGPLGSSTGRLMNVLHCDLLNAADSITNTMSNLVKELQPGTEEYQMANMNMAMKQISNGQLYQQQQQNDQMDMQQQQPLKSSLSSRNQAPKYSQNSNNGLLR